jgi:D-alanyl-D-alanine carboxypeptidase (penicillin-binding protein 5/6)
MPMNKHCLIFAVTLIILLAPIGSFGKEAIKIDCLGGAILVEQKTSKVLFEQDADKRWSPASTTKIMTAIIALEQGNLSDDVVFSENATKTDGSKLKIEKGIRVPLYPLLEAMLIRSGNDAAVAIAEHIAGSQAEFVKKMNAKAQLLGMMNTHYANVSGLPDSTQYTTARDLSKLAVYAMGREEFRQIVAKRETTFISPDGTKDEIIYTTNRLIGRHPLVNGVKTGFTSASKYCLAASAEFRDYQLVSVVLGAESSQVWLESARLLDYGFAMNDPLYPLYREFALEIPEDQTQPEEGE